MQEHLPLHRKFHTIISYDILELQWTKKWNTGISDLFKITSALEVVEIDDV